MDVWSERAGTERMNLARTPGVERGLKAGVSRILRGTDPDFDDAVQDGWIALLRQREMRSPISVAFHAGRSAAIEILRRRKRSLSCAPLEAVADRVGAPGESRTPFLRARLEQALSQLPPGQRHVFTRTAILVHTLADVAEDAGIHPGSARSQAFKARQHLKRALADLDPRQKHDRAVRLAS